MKHTILLSLNKDADPNSKESYCRLAVAMRDKLRSNCVTKHVTLFLVHHTLKSSKTIANNHVNLNALELMTSPT